MSDFGHLLGHDASWIYAGLFLYAFVKTGPLPIAAAYGSTLGWLDAGWALLAVAAGALAGDQVRFEVGRRYGASILTRFPRWAARAEAALVVVERHHVPVLVLFRFAKGLRTPVSLGLGATRLDRGRFTVLNAVTALVWSATLSGLGLAAGAVVTTSHSRLIPIASLVTMVGMVSALGWTMRREVERRLVGVSASSEAAVR